MSEKSTCFQQCSTAFLMVSVISQNAFYSENGKFAFFEVFYTSDIVHLLRFGLGGWIVFYEPALQHN